MLILAICDILYVALGQWDRGWMALANQRAGLKHQFENWSKICEKL